MGFNPLHCGAVVASFKFLSKRRTFVGNLNPLHCGAVVASNRELKEVHHAQDCLNPLHCGAVVASKHRRGRKPKRARLNPLHCGAVVASPRKRAPARDSHPGSIPFIAGQWSLPTTVWRAWQAEERLNPLHCGAVVASEERAQREAAARVDLNPLHCGAVVASQRLPAPPPRAAALNPLHCGAVVASILRRKKRRRSRVYSIPFIAGQWSLPSRAAASCAARRHTQSPSLRGSGRFPRSGFRGRCPH